MLEGIISFSILGLFVGSFLNVCIYRYHTNLSIVSGRSKCFSCGKQLLWYELIPIVSFVIQVGKCRKCNSKISLQYPFVEILTAVLFALIYYRQYTLVSNFVTVGTAPVYGLLLFYMIIMAILLVIATYDLKHKIIPDSLVYIFIILSISKLIFFVFFYGPFLSIYLYDLFAPIILFLFFWTLWFVSKGSWIGFGDVKLVLGIGALLGFVSGISAVIIAFWIGAVTALTILFVNKLSPKLLKINLSIKSEIPFAPFLILGIVISFLIRPDVLGLGALLNL